jgi:large subunit ribosomal protein L25
MDPVTLTATSRTATGKKNRALRRTGQVPVHLYGLLDPPQTLQASLQDVRQVLRTAGITTPVRVHVEGSPEAVALVRDIDRHPVSGDLLHVDFQRVDPDKPVETRVPLRVENASSAPGTRGGAGVVTQGLYEVTVRAKPFDIPRELVADCMKLVAFDSVIKVSDLDYPAGVEAAGNVSANVVWIQAPRVTKVEEPVAAEAAAEGEAAEGEAAAAAPAGAKGAAPAAAAGKAPAAGAKAEAAPAGGRRG